MGPGPAGDAVLSAYAQSLIKFKARQLSRKPGFTRSDQDDLRQELRLHLWRQLVHYDPARGSVNTFLARLAEKWAAEVIRHRRRLKRGGGQHVASLDADASNIAEPAESTPTSQRVTEADRTRRLGQASTPGNEATDLALDVSAVVAGLPPDLRELCMRLAKGNEVSVARDLGVSRRTIREKKQRLRRHFERAGFDGKF